ncbi:hypothetical protein E2C01_053779 [Portunus trituberculatus]|uniref:Uncharacterized protein n=1 Tax=Portunus trituberculatus TaxID=210409 RepID=A0A5B7GI42_PORTR|nr:hypothetical protein [Portunus trituberculatus]
MRIDLEASYPARMRGPGEATASTIYWRRREVRCALTDRALGVYASDAVRRCSSISISRDLAVICRECDSCYFPTPRQLKQAQRLPWPVITPRLTTASSSSPEA